MDKEKQKQSKKMAKKRAASKGNKNIVKKMTFKETKDLINQIANSPCDPKIIIKELGEKLLPKFKANKLSKKGNKRFEKIARKALMMYGIENHYPLAETINENYRPFIIEFSNQLIREYNCQNPSEMALVEVIANAYLKVIDGSRRLNNELGEAGQIINENRTKHLTMLSKQLDRSNRQFITALTTLKQIKAPSLSINVKTKAAFVAQNQQLNTNEPNKENLNKNETIKPK